MALLKYCFTITKAIKKIIMRKVKKRLTILIDSPTIDYFKKMGEEINMPYHTLINMYLSKCAREKYRLITKIPQAGA
jgi:hypothetical protein